MSTTNIYPTKPPTYFPIDRGLYEVAPGLKNLGHDFGNGEIDSKVFQIDSDFQLYRENKLKCRAERLSKYYVTQELSTEKEVYLTEFIVQKLVQEYPTLFKLEQNKLHCIHTKDILTFSDNWQLIDFKSNETTSSHALDALALQIQEDLALTTRRADKTDYISLLHLCSPSHWAAEDKIGNSFFETHKNIPGIDKINRVAQNMVEAMINKGPFVRFIWSFVTDTRLNHHTVAPEGVDSIKWKGRSFNKTQEVPFSFRVERQVIYGLPQIESSLFTIRISFINGAQIKNNSNWRNQLIAALNSMTPESRVYKGVADCFEDLVSWLNN
jgi:dimethylamine monooxygenase subunit A